MNDPFPGLDVESRSPMMQITTRAKNSSLVNFLYFLRLGLYNRGITLIPSFAVRHAVTRYLYG